MTPGADLATPSPSPSDSEDRGPWAVSGTASVASMVSWHVEALLALLSTADPEHLYPSGDRVAVLPLGSYQETRASGLIVVSERNRQAWRGLVLAVGPGVVRDGMRVPPEVAPGDLVVLGPYVGEDVELHGQRVRLIPGADVLARVAM